VLIGIVAGLGGGLRFYRTIMLDEMRNDYVRTALAKGLSPVKVLFKHVLKNAMIPIITQTVLAIPFLFLGSLLLERFFGIPGLGYLLIEAIGARDFQVINAVTYIGAILFVVFNVITDVCYALVDPRVSLE
ncbi:MAG TPA: ABC transporter permease, partial [Sedimentisphaerales bacterium]|nr:ABC transporter permease [Sedimentisphaerales bacterium]